tara:strand:- start:384 stop:839 length:456 start_codon:yes stop_codon:yes gene_type:complete
MKANREQISMKWTGLIVLAALITFSSIASEFDDTLKLAEQGDADAQYNLGVMYDNGQGVPQDFKQAVKWYRKAAEQGYADAQYNLAIRYYKGQGVIQSNKQSYIWNAIAAANGHEGAVKNRDLDAKILSPKALEEAQEEAAKLYDKINSTK